MLHIVGRPDTQWVRIIGDVLNCSHNAAKLVFDVLCGHRQLNSLVKFEKLWQEQFVKPNPYEKYGITRDSLAYLMLDGYEIVKKETPDAS